MFSSLGNSVASAGDKRAETDYLNPTPTKKHRHNASNYNPMILPNIIMTIGSTIPIPEFPDIVIFELV